MWTLAYPQSATGSPVQLAVYEPWSCGYSWLPQGAYTLAIQSASGKDRGHGSGGVGKSKHGQDGLGSTKLQLETGFI